MPLPVKNFLTSEQVSRLQNALKESELSHIRKQILIILLQNNDKIQQKIANFLGCSPRTVADWCMHGDPDYLESLHNKRDQESYRKAISKYINMLLNTVDKSPQELEFGRWTGERLATYLAEQTGIELIGLQVRRILKRSELYLGKV